MLQYFSWDNIYTGLNLLLVLDEPILDPVFLYHSICNFRLFPSVKKLKYLFIFSEFLIELELLYKIYIVASLDFIPVNYARLRVLGGLLINEVGHLVKSRHFNDESDDCRLIGWTHFFDNYNYHNIPCSTFLSYFPNYN